jgi:hypothetical protein
MRLFISLSVAVMLGVLALAGCNSVDKDRAAANMNGGLSTANPSAPQQSQAATAPSDGARRITTVELNEALNKGEALVVDVRGGDAYKQSHIKGSILIPFNEIGNRVGELPHDKLIVTYCS